MAVDPESTRNRQRRQRRLRQLTTQFVGNTLALILFLLFFGLVLYIFSAERPVP